MKTSLFTLTFLLLSHFLYSQDDTKNSKYQLSYIGLDLSVFTTSWNEMSNDEIQSLPKNEYQFLKDKAEKIEGFSTRHGSLKMGINSRWQSTKNANREIHVSANVYMIREYIATYNENIYVGFDSVDIGFGRFEEEHYYLFPRYTINFEAVQVALSLSNNYFTNRDKKFSVRAGYGLALGTTLLPRIVVEGYSMELTTNEYDEDFIKPNSIFLAEVKKVDSEPTKMMYFVRPYVPIGVDIRMANKENSGGVVYLNMMAAFGMEFRQVGTFSDFSHFYTLGAGLSYRI